MSTLSPSDIKKNLENLTYGWVYEDNKIVKRFEFSNFREALAFLNKVGEIAETLNHHPDMHLTGWNKVALELSTHDDGGVTQKDFHLATDIDTLSMS